MKPAWGGLVLYVIGLAAILLSVFLRDLKSTVKSSKILIPAHAAAATPAAHHRSEPGTMKLNSFMHDLKAELIERPGLTPYIEYSQMTHEFEQTVTQTIESHLLLDRFLELPELQSNEIVEENKSLVSHVIYINMRKNQDREKGMHQQIQAQKFGHDVRIWRFEGMRDDRNGARGCFRSHLQCLAFASTLPGHTLILEDDFQFDVPRTEYERWLSRADGVTRSRWDVILFGQYVSAWTPLQTGSNDMALYRVDVATTTSGYLVHEQYARDLFMKWYQHYQPIADKPRFQHLDNLDQIQPLFQRVDCWLAFHQSIGSQKPGTSIIGDTWASNRWRTNEAGDVYYTPQHPQGKSLHVGPPLTLQKVAVCLVATGRYVDFIDKLVHSVKNRFLKPHPLHFFLFTDQVDLFEGRPDFSTFTIERKGFPFDTLYRYRFMLLAETQLVQEGYDFMFYMDADYYVANAVRDLMLTDKPLLATQHLHMLHVSNANAHGLKGTPDQSGVSQASFKTDEHMKAYVCGGFQGGRVKQFLSACHTMDQMIQMDEANGVTPLWHDESIWNRYVQDHSDEVEYLTISHVFQEECLDLKQHGGMQNCQGLETQNYPPLMVALAKKHSQVRAP